MVKIQERKLWDFLQAGKKHSFDITLFKKLKKIPWNSMNILTIMSNVKQGKNMKETSKLSLIGN